MNRASWRGSALLVLCVAATACMPRSPASEADIREALDSLWEEQLAAPEVATRYDARPNLQCARLDHDAAADAKAKRAYQWFAQVDPAGVVAPRQAARIARLEALAAVGLLEKLPVTLAGGVGHRYRHTDAGWAASASSARPFCFIYGSPRPLGVVSHELLRRDARRFHEFYRVKARIGFGDIDELAPWARHAAARAAFPEIQRDLDGVVREVLLERGPLGWSVALERKRRKKAAGFGRFWPRMPPEDRVKALLAASGFDRDAPAGPREIRHIAYRPFVQWGKPQVAFRLVFAAPGGRADKACEGTFQYEAGKDQFGTGSASCWPTAFEE